MTDELEAVDFLKEPMAIGQIFVESGMFKDIKTQAQAVVKILAGKELGMTAFEAMSSLYIVNDRLSLTSNAMASLIKRNKKYDYTVDSLDDLQCTISFYRIVEGKSEPLGQSIFTFKDAAKAGLANKEVWKNYPRNMLFARALSNGVKWFCPESTSGYYTVEEMQDIEALPIEPQKHIIEMTAEGVTNGKEA